MTRTIVLYVSIFSYLRIPFDCSPKVISTSSLSSHDIIVLHSTASVESINYEHVLPGTGRRCLIYRSGFVYYIQIVILFLYLFSSLYIVLSQPHLIDDKVQSKSIFLRAYFSPRLNRRGAQARHFVHTLSERLEFTLK